MNGFGTKNVRVLIAETSNQVRPELVMAIRAMGIEHIETVKSAEEVKRWLTSHPVDWVISSSFREESFSAIQLLQFMASQEQLSSVYVSLLVNDQDLPILPKAFESGLFSWHQKHITKDFLKSSFQELFDTYQKQNKDSSLTAAVYLRRHLMHIKDYESLMSLELHLLERHPGDAQLLLNLAESQFLAGKTNQALATLHQAKCLDSRLAKQAEELRSRHFNSTNSAQMMARNLQSIVVVEPDESIQNSLRQILTEVGATQLHCFEDGESAWQWLRKNPEPDLLLMEWKLPQLPGVALVQRVRNYGYNKVPVMVLSSLVTKQDTPLLNEMSVAAIVIKPIEKQQLLLNLNWVLVQDNYPTEQKTMERKMLQLLRSGKFEDAQVLFSAYVADARVTPNRRKYMEAEFMYAAGRYEEAKNLVIESIRGAEQDTVATTSLLGKCLLKLGDLSSALQFLEKAQSSSVGNIERLCTIAEIQHEIGKKDEAQDSLSKVESIDSSCSELKQAKAKIHVLEGRTEEAKECLNEIENLSPFVSFMNMKAITKIRMGQAGEGLKLYQQILTAIPTQNHDDKMAVMYNLGLAFARNNQPSEAQLWLKQVAQQSKNETIKTKAGSLCNRVELAVKMGKPIELVSKNEAGKTGDVEFEALLSENEQAPTEDFSTLFAEKKLSAYCLYRIFHAKN